MDVHPWQLWSGDGKPNFDTVEIVATLEAVLKKHPNHLGANHYYIHAVEASNDPARALPSANRLAALAPAAGHLVHMPATFISGRGAITPRRRRTNAQSRRTRSSLRRVKRAAFTR
jgi:hypothetical protein